MIPCQVLYMLPKKLLKMSAVREFGGDSICLLFDDFPHFSRVVLAALNTTFTVPPFSIPNHFSNIIYCVPVKLP